MFISISTLLGVEEAEEKEFLITFGKNFRRLRKSKDFTQAKLAIDLGTDISQISRIERGIISTSVSKLKAISNILEIPIKDFFDFKSDK